MLHGKNDNKSHVWGRVMAEKMIIQLYHLTAEKAYYFGSLVAVQWH